LTDGEINDGVSILAAKVVMGKNSMSRAQGVEERDNAVIG
jgi:hypothetical protein